MTGRTVLYSSLCIAPLAWACVFLFTFLVPPKSPLIYATLFLLLGIALTSTFTPIAYGIGLRFITSRLYRATMRHALRQGLLLALVIIFNLMLRVWHSWNILAALIIFVAAVIIEVLSLARK